MFIRSCCLAAVFVSLTYAAYAQSLGGPSSVQADLQPGDGLTDPQFRLDFPVNIAPGYFEWKEGLAQRGFSFNVDYLTLGQTSNSDLGEGDASGGIFRLYGNWKATENGSLTFKLEDRHAYSDVAPQNFGFDGGALSITGTAFNDNGTLLTNLFWTQRAADGSWVLQIWQ